MNSLNESTTTNDKTIINCEDTTVSKDKQKIAKLITSTVLQCALCKNDVWSRFILLAAVEILHGKEVPLLSTKVLKLLEGMQEFQASDTTVTSSQPDEKVNAKLEKKRNFDVYGENNNNAILGIDAAVQCSSHMLRSMKSKFIQVKIAKNVSQETQTYKYIADKERQCFFMNDVKKALCVNSETQTQFVLRSDVSCQTQKVWKLTRISEEIIHRPVKNQSKEGNIRLFCGRPLIEKFSDHCAAEILLDAISDGTNVLVDDPRISTLDMCDFFDKF